MKLASEKIQKVLKEADYMQVKLHSATKHGEAKSLATELTIALRKVQELNEAQQQAQFDYECLENKLKYIKQVETLGRVSQVFYLTDETIRKLKEINMRYLSDEVNMDDEFDYLGETYFNPLKESVYNTWWNNTQGE